MRNFMQLVGGLFESTPGVTSLREIEDDGSRNETLWVNGRTDEIIDVEESGAAHHAEFLVDNPEEMGLNPRAPAIVAAREMEYEDIVSDPALRQEAFRRGWTRCNYHRNSGTLNIEALNNNDAVSSCQTLQANGFPLRAVNLEMRGRWFEMTGADLEAFLQG